MKKRIIIKNRVCCAVAFEFEADNFTDNWYDIIADCISLGNNRYIAKAISQDDFNNFSADLISNLDWLDSDDGYDILIWQISKASKILNAKYESISFDAKF